MKSLIYLDNIIDKNIIIYEETLEDIKFWWNL
jgi:hypothetical protein